MALLVSRDQHHPVVAAAFPGIAYSERIATSEAALHETVNLLIKKRRDLKNFPDVIRDLHERLSKIIGEGFLKILPPPTPEEFEEIRMRHRGWIRTIPDLSLVDAETAWLCGRYSIRRLLTGDGHFASLGMGLEIHPKLQIR